MPAPVRIEQESPCAIHRRLADAYEKVVLGQSVRSVRYRNGEEEQQTDFHPGNLAELRRLVIAAKAECDAAQGAGRRAPTTIRFSTSKGL